MARSYAIQNPDQLLENMLTIRSILSEGGVRCFLHFGTLLGAIREKGFIPHDDDADLGVFGNDYDALLALIPKICAAGFSFNSQRGGRLLQFVRNDEQVDLFVAYSKKSLIGRRWAIDERTTVPGSWLDTLVPIDFYGNPFLVPVKPERLMRNLYGKTWRIPLKNMPSRTNWTWKIRKIARQPLKLFFYMGRYLKTQKRKRRISGDPR